MISFSYQKFTATRRGILSSHTEVLMGEGNMKRRWIGAFAAAVTVFLLSGCGDGGNGTVSSSAFTITSPSARERNFGEKRDFTVAGTFSGDVQTPGDILIELFEGETTTGTPIRVIRSHVDPETGVTPDSAFDTTYPHGHAYGLNVAPDIIKEPGGIMNPSNKVLVTKTDFTGIVLGGATKDFDTSYTDEQGGPLRDLTAGTYTLRVTGLSGDVAGASAQVEITFHPNHMLLGRFRPDEHVSRLLNLSRSLNYRVLTDPFPGYYSRKTPDGKAVLYEVQERWHRNNAVEVVNDLPGVVYTDISSFENDLILYNVTATCATQKVEIATVARYSLVDSPQTLYWYYDLGEPSLQYTDEKGKSKKLDGNFAYFRSEDRLELNRAEVRDSSAAEQDYLEIIGDETQKSVDSLLSDGVRASEGDVVSIYGTVRPLPAGVTPDPADPTQFSLDNRISDIQYNIFDKAGNLLSDQVKSVHLDRVYDPSAPTSIQSSIYEFKHDFRLTNCQSRCSVTLKGYDAAGREVSGTEETIVISTQ